MATQTLTLRFRITNMDKLLAQLRILSDGLTDDQIAKLIEHRGGCECHIMPPCIAHSTALTYDEAVELGWINEIQIQIIT